MNMKEKTDFKSIFLCTKSKRNLNVFMRGQNKLSGHIQFRTQISPCTGS